MATRKGMMKGKGRGYKNVIGKDPYVHSQSARGIKQPQRIPHIPLLKKSNIKTHKDWYILSDKNEVLILKALDENKEIHVGNEKNRFPAMKKDKWRVSFAENNYSSPSDSWTYDKKSDALKKAETLMSERIWEEMPIKSWSNNPNLPRVKYFKQGNKFVVERTFPENNIVEVWFEDRDKIKYPVDVKEFQHNWEGNRKALKYRKELMEKYGN